jgi:putative transposase
MPSLETSVPRYPRYVIPGQPQHVIVRGNNRQPIFQSERDRRIYLEALKRAIDKQQCAVHAYVLMTNHVHLLLTPHTEDGIGKAMQSVGRTYVQYFNHIYERTGTLWEGRYRAALVDSERYLLTCYRYIELNPVRAGSLADHPSAYPWSSYHFNALGMPDELITPHCEYLRLGKDRETRLSAYRSLFRSHIPDRTLVEIRDATNKSWVLGSARYKDSIARQLDRQVGPKPRGGDRRSETFKKSRIA